MFDVIIIGGSYAGLSAAMALGRSLRHVLVIDSGKPCNRQTPHSHNFITHDGAPPASIAAEAKEQTLRYETVEFLEDVAASAERTENGFRVKTESGKEFDGRKLLFACGVLDIMPDIPGFAECWGISVLHCPYCHGYEVRNEPTGILADGDMGFEFVKLIGNWTKDLTLFTNGPSTLSAEQKRKLAQKNVTVVEKEIGELEHESGQIRQIRFRDGSRHSVTAIYARVAFRQHCTIPEELGCALTDQGYLDVNDWQQTSVRGIYAAGDATTMFRAVSAAVADGTRAGGVLNKEMIDEDFGE